MISFRIAVRLVVLSLFLLLYNPSPGQSHSRVDSLLKLLKSASTDSVKILLNIEISDHYINTDLSQAIIYAENAVELAENGKDTAMLTKSLNNIGNVCFNQGFFELALAHYNRNLRIQEMRNNKKGIASTLINIGAIQLNSGKFRQARDNFTGALSMFEELSRTSGSDNYRVEIITTCNNLGIACQNMQDFQQAETYYYAGIELAKKKAENAAELANLYNNLAHLYLLRKEPDKAYDMIQKALEIRLQTGDKTGEAQSYRRLAEYYIERGDPVKAIGYLYKGYRLSLAIGNLSLQSNLASKLFNEYNKMGRADSALKYHLIYSSLETEMHNEETQRELARIELTSQFREREQLREQEQRAKETRYFFIGAALALSTVILGLLFLLLQNRMKRLRLQKDLVDLTSRNLALEKYALENELELRNKELTTNVMYLVQKNEYITGIAERLTSVSERLPESNHSEITRLINDLKQNRDHKIWTEFELRFKEVHRDFYTRLNQRFPNLTPNEKKLAAFLRLNMTTKDIAAITLQLPDSIKTARSRLRKKLGLAQEANLIAFLESI